MSDLKDNFVKRLLSVKDSIKVKVRFDDTDAMGVVHFKNYLIYLDDGFVAFMNQIENPVEIAVVKEGIVFPVKKIDIVYENFAKFGDYIIVNTQIKEVGKSSITFLHQMYRKSDNALLAKVECIRLIMNLQTKELLNAQKFLTKYV
ncbi:MAG: hypothetical protein GF353_04580 [Candidatus Lokiarchaeota archaeon]|nr:hypothetical protein [Candidatus Lokiarchaeota archaeon]